MINNSINPLIILSAKFKEGKVSGLIYQLNESLGVIQTSKVKELVKTLSTKDKEILINSGVKIENCLYGSQNYSKTTRHNTSGI